MNRTQPGTQPAPRAAVALPMKSPASTLRDFTEDRSSRLADVRPRHHLGIGGAALAVLLLRAIALVTNLFYYHRFSLAMVGPAGSSLGYWMVLVPIVGGIIVGIMARFGSDKIRGHGIPEAIEADPAERRRVEPQALPYSSRSPPPSPSDPAVPSAPKVRSS